MWQGPAMLARKPETQLLWCSSHRNHIPDSSETSLSNSTDTSWTLSIRHCCKVASHRRISPSDHRLHLPKARQKNGRQRFPPHSSPKSTPKREKERNTRPHYDEITLKQQLCGCSHDACMGLAYRCIQGSTVCSRAKFILTSS